MILIGCSSPSQVVIEPIKPIFALPEPVHPPKVKWKVITKESMNKEKDVAVFIGMSYDDSIEFRKWLESIKTHIDKQNMIICAHQECK